MTCFYFKIDLLKSLFICVSLLSFYSSYSQLNDTSTYLLVRFERFFDNTNQRAYYLINPERGCEEAASIYSLIKYDSKKNAVNTSGKFYFNNRNITDSLYNYFLSPTEGLNYMSKIGWNLISIFTETLSGSNNERTGSGELVPVITVSSRPIFCFKK